MRSRVNLVAILLTLSCVIRLLESAKSQKQTSHTEFTVAKKIIKEVHKLAPTKASLTKVVPQSTIIIRQERPKPLSKNVASSTALSKDYFSKPGRPRRRKRKMGRTMMALLMAYKMKFVALIPTLVGGLILLKATALLAGFFFALFAAVLGLKTH
ncbi:uncharacterized protein LOC100879823 [Megachile rotundata]|uniref:uncharacterized protein LOC100879823 n=1 Tax=Megachile rotundata TaxID=143995 RepID=UPI000258EC03|nr:PREDICTED: uncharacterized protein LOC100879823 [Megachile rotundata]